MRTGDREIRPLWLSVVVLEELYVGAVEAKMRRDLQRMEREFDKIGRLLLPDRRAWTSAGQVLSKIGQKYGFNLVGKARLTNEFSSEGTPVSPGWLSRLSTGELGA